MLLEGEAYSRRLESFADSTIELMLFLTSSTKEISLRTTDIMANSELTEKQVVEKLLKLKELAEQQKGT